MCGIIAYLGNQKVLPILLNGLYKLEYRGYDSAGIAGILCEKMVVHKEIGQIKNLHNKIQYKLNDNYTVGIGHTRWATHGPPNLLNCHPHMDYKQSIAVVHNGIIENYEELRDELIEQGFIINSQTDTEIIVHLIDREMTNDVSLYLAVKNVTKLLKGTYGIVVISLRDPNIMVGAKRASPLLIGVGENNNYFLASDASAILNHTKKVIYLEDDEVVIISRIVGYMISNQTDVVERDPITLDMDISDIGKNGYKHFMLKEIMEQTSSLKNCIAGRLTPNNVKLKSLNNIKNELINCEKITICACGTSWHAGIIGKYLIENFSKISVNVDYASEYRYRNPVYSKNEILIVISQSGETADTLACVTEANKNNVTTLGICNVIGSTIARTTTSCAYLHIGPEIGVASTKAFSGQVIVLYMLALYIAQLKDLKVDNKLYLELLEIPNKINETIQIVDEIKHISNHFRYADHFMYLGRGYNYPVALEGALKLKEISYIHAEGYPSAEMKHGPIALIDKSMPVIFIALKSDSLYDKIKANIQEVKARGGILIIITNKENTDFDDSVEFIIKVPDVKEYLSPLITIIPLQLLSYYIADIRQCEIDKPRNLAKSVTVE
jgi:glucosamine--fructose-6-phosphate aminotransferase (isomerizing)